MQTYMAKAFRQNQNRPVQDLGSSQLGGNGLLNHSMRNQVGFQIDWRKDPTITPFRLLLRQKM